MSGSLNFSQKEFACKDWCGLNNIAPEQYVIAELVRQHEGNLPLSPISGCRCVNHNEFVQKKYVPNYVPFSSKSKHMPNEDGVCTAADYPSKNPDKLYEYLDGLFPNTYGIGVYSWGVHVDTRHNKARWGVS